MYRAYWKCKEKDCHHLAGQTNSFVLNYEGLLSITAVCITEVSRPYHNSNNVKAIILSDEHLEMKTSVRHLKKKTSKNCCSQTG